MDLLVVRVEYKHHKSYIILHLVDINVFSQRRKATNPSIHYTLIFKDITIAVKNFFF